MKRIALLLLFLLQPQFLFAAVGHDNELTATADGTITITISSFAITGSNIVLLCGSMTKFYTTTGVTFNSVPMTLLDTAAVGNSELTMWQLKGDDGASGTHDIVFTFDAVNSAGVVGCVSKTGVDQTTSTGTTVKSITNYTEPVDMTVPANGLSWDIVGFQDPTTVCEAMTTTGDNTKDFDDCSESGGGASDSMGSSYRTTSGVHSWTDHSGAYYLQIGVP